MAIVRVQTSRLAQSADLTFRCEAALVVSKLVPFGLRVQPCSRNWALAMAYEGRCLGSNKRSSQTQPTKVQEIAPDRLMMSSDP